MAQIVFAAGAPHAPAIVGLFDGHVQFIKWDRYFKILADPSKNELWCYPKSKDGR